MMARMILIKLDGQISSNAERVHMGVGMGTIWGDCGAKVGVFVCHLVVGLQSIKADGCPEAGVVACHSVWACQSSRLMIVAPGLGSFDATWLWTWVSSDCCQRRIQTLVALPSIGL